jgi:hypothetical protein
MVLQARQLSWKRTPLSMPSLRSSWYRLRSSSGPQLDRQSEIDKMDETFNEKGQVAGDDGVDDEDVHGRVTLYPELYPVISSTSTLFDEDDPQSSDDDAGSCYDELDPASPSPRRSSQRHRGLASPRPERKILTLSYDDDDYEDDFSSDDDELADSSNQGAQAASSDDDSDIYVGKPRGNSRFTSPEMLRLEEEHRGRSRRRRLLWRSAVPPLTLG